MRECILKFNSVKMLLCNWVEGPGYWSQLRCIIGYAPRVFSLLVEIVQGQSIVSKQKVGMANYGVRSTVKHSKEAGWKTFVTWSRGMSQMWGVCCIFEQELWEGYCTRLVVVIGYYMVIIKRRINSLRRSMQKWISLCPKIFGVFELVSI